jgi:hypothetical protein
MTPRTPSTEAGRRYVERVEREQLWHPVDGRRDETVASILAIESEARAEVTDDMTTAYMVGFENGKDEARAPLEAATERLRAALKLALTAECGEPDDVCWSDNVWHNAARAALEEPTT